LGIPSDYIEYMMGHKLSTYHDVQMKGVEFLRNVYASANLKIFPKARTKEEVYEDLLKRWFRMAKEEGISITPSMIERIIRELEGSEKIMPGATFITEEEESEIYARTLWEMLRADILSRLVSTPEKGINIKSHQQHRCL